MQYDRCYIDALSYDDVAMIVNCSEPRRQRRRFTILFEPFQSIPNAPEYMPGRSYYYVSMYNKKHLKNVGPIRHASRRTPIQQVSLPVLSHAACASMSTTTTTTTTRDRGDRYGPMEWAQ